MIKVSLENLTKYNLWANAKILEFIIEAGEEKADIIQKSSFPSVRETLYHIWGAETIWINRLLGKSFTGWPEKSFIATVKEAGILILNTSSSFVTFAESKKDDEFSSIIFYKNLEGKEFSNSVSQIIMHCMNHSTFHRGQIITLLRNTGSTKFSSTDYITFCRP